MLKIAARSRAVVVAAVLTATAGLVGFSGTPAAHAAPADPPTASCISTRNFVAGAFQNAFYSNPSTYSFFAPFIGPYCATTPFGCGTNTAGQVCNLEVAVIGAAAIGRAAVAVVLEVQFPWSDQWFNAQEDFFPFLKTCSAGNQASTNASCPAERVRSVTSYDPSATYRARCYWQRLPVSEFAVSPTLQCLARATHPAG